MTSDNNGIAGNEADEVSAEPLHVYATEGTVRLYDDEYGWIAGIQARAGGYVVDVPLDRVQLRAFAEYILRVVK